MIAPTSVTGFVGIAERGPLDAPVRLASWDEFVAAFGDGGDGYLGDAVHGFFGNGGDACWVVRVARGATAAELVLRDGWGKPVLRVVARDPGAWGNAITVRCERPAATAEALAVRDVELGACEAQVSTTRGFEVGAVMRLSSAHGADHVVVTEVGDHLLRWSAATSVDHRHVASAPTRIEVVAFALEVALGGRRERFDGLQLDPASASYAPRVLARRSKLVRLDDLGTRSPVPHHLPAATAIARLRGGRDGVDRIVADDFIGRDGGPGDRTGLAAVAAVDEVALVAVPDAMWLHDRAPGPAGELAAQRVQDELVAACERRDDRFAILDIPRGTDVDRVRRWRHRVDSSHAAFYWPWLEVACGGRRPRVVPPSGLVAGCFARRDHDGVHHAPANLEVVGARDVVLRLTDDHVAALDADAINTFRVQRGVRPWGRARRRRSRRGARCRCGGCSSCCDARSMPDSRGSRSSPTTRARRGWSATASPRSSASCTSPGCSPARSRSTRSTCAATARPTRPTTSSAACCAARSASRRSCPRSSSR